MRKVVNILLILVVSYACIEPYDFTVRNTEQYMVVDASFTSEVKIQEVTLFKSYALIDTFATNVRDANVTILEEGGNEFEFVETETGTYLSKEQFGGKSGLSYVLKIEMPDGTTYESLSEVMPDPTPIDSIYGKYMERFSTETSDMLQGVQFFVDSHNDSEASSSYRFKYREDYEIMMPLTSYYEYLRETDEIKYRDPGIGRCYNYRLSTDFLTETTSGLSENRLSEFPIVYVEENEIFFRTNYRLTLYQLSITAAAFQYYKSLKENNESSGSFFDKQKGSVLGNISNVDDPAEPVLGYFEVAAVSEAQRKFSVYEFYKDGYIPERFSYCNYNSVADTLPVDTLKYLPQIGVSRNLYVFADIGHSQVVTVPAECSDCRYYGVLDKPENWD